MQISHVVNTNKHVRLFQVRRLNYFVLLLLLLFVLISISLHYRQIFYELIFGKIIKAIKTTNEDPSVPSNKNPYGTGHAAQKIINILRRKI